MTKAVLIIIITYYSSGVTSEQIEFATLTDCHYARLELPEIEGHGLWREAFCVEVTEAHK